jgi:hypothetical protein
MATLFNTKIKDTYQSLLKLEDNTILTTTTKNVTDGLGNASPLFMSTTQVRIASTGGSFQVRSTSDSSSSIAIGNDTVNSRLILSGGESSNGSVARIQGNGVVLNMRSSYLTIASSNLDPNNTPSLFGIRGVGSTSATTSFLVQNSLGNNVFSIKDDENTLIGSGTNGGYKLDVNGTSNIRGSLRMGEPSVAGLVRSHPSVAMNFGGGAGDNVFTFTQINQGAFQSSSANQSLIRASINQGELGTTNYGSVFLSIGTLTNSGGTPIYNSFESRQTINCSGGTTVYRGFYHNPILTSTTGVTHRAIETVTGNVILGSTSGNTLIGTTTDSGFKLDVNGTTRIQGNTNVTGFLSATSYLECRTQFLLRNGLGGGHTGFSIDSTNLYLVNSTSINFQIGYSGNYSFILNNANRTIGMADNGATAITDASSVLTLTSTTKGFLPPRMLQTQRTAITSPAIGLMVYQTDMVEGLYIYKSTGWTFII